MQDVVENALNEMLRESRAAWGTAILMKVDDGDIKAIRTKITYVKNMCLEPEEIEALKA